MAASIANDDSETEDKVPMLIVDSLQRAIDALKRRMEKGGGVAFVQAE